MLARSKCNYTGSEPPSPHLALAYIICVFSLYCTHTKFFSCVFYWYLASLQVFQFAPSDQIPWRASRSLELNYGSLHKVSPNLELLHRRTAKKYDVKPKPIPILQILESNTICSKENKMAALMFRSILR